jgi:hypothetical protein
VFCHPQVVENQADITCQLSHFLCYTAYAFGFDGSDGESPESSDIFRAITGADQTAIFIVIPIDDVMAAILDGPVATINVKDTLWVSLLHRSTGDAVGDLTRANTTLFLCSVRLDEEGLSDVGKVKVIVDLGCGPDLSDFDSSMVGGGRMLNEIRLLAVLQQ